MTDKSNFTNAHGLFELNFDSCSKTDYDRPDDYPNDPMKIIETTIKNNSGTNTREHI
jgi:hypothetical protein